MLPMDPASDFTTGAVAAAEESLERMPLGGFSARDSSRREAQIVVAERVLKRGDDPRPRTTVEALDHSAIASLHLRV